MPYNFETTNPISILFQNLLTYFNHRFQKCKVPFYDRATLNLKCPCHKMGLYIKFSMDLVESCWIEIEPGIHKKKIVIGCIYRHPRANIEIFTDQLNELLKNLNYCIDQFYILGDINIDFLRYLNYQPTEKYLDILYTNNTLPVITKPTRITNHILKL